MPSLFMYNLNDVRTYDHVLLTNEEIDDLMRSESKFINFEFVVPLDCNYLIKAARKHKKYIRTYGAGRFKHPFTVEHLLLLKAELLKYDLNEV
jgi:hypothetical protein